MAFGNSTPELTCVYKEKGTHGGNHAPSVADWFKNDDTLDRQGKSAGSPNGHGICAGVSTAWVIAFLNGVRDASDPALYEKYYTDFLRYQATMIKDWKSTKPDSLQGVGIPTHLKVFKKFGMDPGVRDYKIVEAVSFSERDGHLHARWAAYCSCWHHGIAIGGSHGSSGPFYIVEPNTGLHGYQYKEACFNDLNEYIAGRRQAKATPDAPAKLWVYI